MEQIERQFYVLTEGKSVAVWQVKDTDLEMLMKRHPGFQLVNSFQSREEAEGERTRLAG